MQQNPGMKRIAQRVQAAQSEATYHATQIYTRGVRDGVAHGLRVGRIQGIVVGFLLGAAGIAALWLLAR